jgi:hypothetical protein
VVDISDQTLDKDFGRNKKIHRCFEIRKYKPEVKGPADVYDADYATSTPASNAAIKAEARQAAEANEKLALQAEMKASIQAETEQASEQEKPSQAKVKGNFNPWLRKD